MDRIDRIGSTRPETGNRKPEKRNREEKAEDRNVVILSEAKNLNMSKRFAVARRFFRPSAFRPLAAVGGGRWAVVSSAGAAT